MAYKVNLHDPDGCCVDHSDSGDGGVLGSEKMNDFWVSAFFSLFRLSSAATHLQYLHYFRTNWVLIRSARGRLWRCVFIC